MAYPECALYEVGGNIGEWDAAATLGTALTFACLSARRANKGSEVLCNELYERQTDRSGASAVIRAEKCLMHT